LSLSFSILAVLGYVTSSILFSHFIPLPPLSRLFWHIGYIMLLYLHLLWPSQNHFVFPLIIW